MVVKFLLVLLLVLLSGCSVRPDADKVSQDPVIDLSWPSAPDRERIRYLRSITGPEDFRTKQKSSVVWSWLVGEPAAQISLLGPNTVAVSNEGVVWVSDGGARMLYRIDVEKEKVRYFQEFDGRRLTTPSGIAIDDSKGRVYLSDAAENFIYVLDFKGKVVGTRSPPGGFLRPAGMTVAQNGSLLVADALAGCIVVFDANGAYLSKIYSQSGGQSPFARPIDVAVGPNNEVLVLDALSFHVEVQDSQGKFLRTIGHIGDAPGSLARPKGLAVDKNGNVFVADAAFDNIQLFDMAGNLLMHWGGAGVSPGQFNLPAGLFVDQQNRLFVADSYNSRVEVFQGL